MKIINFIKPSHKKSYDHATWWFRITIASLLITIGTITFIHLKTRRTWQTLHHEKLLHQSIQEEATRLEQELQTTKKLHEELIGNQKRLQHAATSNKTLLATLTTLYSHAQELNVSIKSLVIEPSIIEACIQAKTTQLIYNFIESIEQKNKLKLVITSIKSLDGAIIATMKNS
jgi:hypothetical protein